MEKLAYTGEDLASLVQELADAAADSLRAGEHEGVCTNFENPYLPCNLHLEACDKRNRRLHAALLALGVENVPNCPIMNSTLTAHEGVTVTRPYVARPDEFVRGTFDPQGGGK